MEYSRSGSAVILLVRYFVFLTSQPSFGTHIRYPLLYHYCYWILICARFRLLPIWSCWTLSRESCQAFSMFLIHLSTCRLKDLECEKTKIYTLFSSFLPFVQSAKRLNFRLVTCKTPFIVLHYHSLTVCNWPWHRQFFINPSSQTSS